MENQTEQTELLHYTVKALILSAILGAYVTVAEPGGLEVRSLLIESSLMQCSDPSLPG